jgi:DNA-binding transcriptional MerR regulator
MAAMSTPTSGSARAGLTLAALARLADVTPRTVRYYVAQGLLPSPGQAGPGARYPESALSRLRLIRELQRNHLPLAEIRTRLAGLSDADVAGLLKSPSAEPPDSALDYIRGVLGAARPAERPLATLPFASTAAPAPAMPTARSETSVVAGPHSGLRAEPVPPALAMPRAGEAAFHAWAPAGDPAAPARSQWDRIVLTPDIELHIRRPLARLAQRRAERLITIAREVLKEDTP